MRQVTVDEDRYIALETLFAVLRYQLEVDNKLDLLVVVDVMFELSKNNSVLGPSNDLISKYECLAKTELLFRTTLAEIANMSGEPALRARMALDEWMKNR